VKSLQSPLERARARTDRASADWDMSVALDTADDAVAACAKGDPAESVPSVDRRAHRTGPATFDRKLVCVRTTEDGQGRTRFQSLSIGAGPEGTGKSTWGIWARGAGHPRHPTWHRVGTPRRMLHVAVGDSWGYTVVPGLTTASAQLPDTSPLTFLISSNGPVILVRHLTADGSPLTGQAAPERSAPAAPPRMTGTSGERSGASLVPCHTLSPSRS